MQNAEIIAFLGDIKDPCGTDMAYLCRNVSGLTVKIIDAWKVVYEARGRLNYKTDFMLLKQVANMLSNSTTLTRLGENDGLKTIIEKNVAAPCYTCQSTSHPYLKTMDEYLKDVQYFAENCFGKVGFDKVLSNDGGIKDNQLAVEGAAFMLRVLADNDLASQVDKFEHNYASPTNEKEVDIVKVGGTLVECKSWAIGSGAFVFFKRGRSTESGSFSQFTSYLRNGIATMNDLEYWFDAKKESDTGKLKDEFKTMMLTLDAQNNTILTPQGNDVFDAVWGNTSGLRTIVFGTRNRDDAESYFIQTLISNTGSAFYNFIKVK